ncbi:MAG: hypothetical protein IK007_01575 [Lachnospiraceae bacterium]|nr:hypothetical protein [Lachnospiraceae bacterium]
MKNKFYTFLVNRQPGIAERYHKFHDGSTGVKRLLSWAYLLWLNFAYYCLFCRFLGKKKGIEYYEEKNLVYKSSESEKYLNSAVGKTWSDVDVVVSALSVYDIVSFDIFDTLILRPVSAPTDVFHMLGEQFGIMDFNNIRAWAESDARVKHYDKYGNTEVNLSEIWENLEKDVGLSASIGMAAENELEEKLCYANSYMKKLWDELVAKGKTIVITTDMYLPKVTIENILQSNGFTGYERLYLSNEYQKSKADGKLYECVKTDHPGKKIIHIGDNPYSDGKMAEKAGLDIRLYPGIFKNINVTRPFDMSAMIGSAYRAIVCAKLYSGLDNLSMDYEYGYVYGGLFVLGYCSFIHKYVLEHGIDKVLFLSRDGDILIQAYDFLYPDNVSSYVYWSRKAATKLEAFYDKHDFFRRFIYHKVNQDYTIEKILKAMELDSLVIDLKDWRSIWEDVKGSEKVFVDLKPQDELTDKNGYLLRRFIEAKWDKVLETYSGQMQAAKLYYRRETEGCSKVLAVDIGWAGSGALALRHLFEHEWGLNTEVTGMVAGTNTVHNFEPDASEPFLQSGKLVAYLYSQAHNRDLLKKHDPNKDYNVFWELLLSSPTPKFEGFYPGPVHGSSVGTVSYLEDLDISLRFGKYDHNQSGIKEIQKGILDFVKDYHLHFKDCPYMFNISGRDAYAPMLVAASHNEKYLKAIEKRYKLEINVD